MFTHICLQTWNGVAGGVIRREGQTTDTCTWLFYQDGGRNSRKLTDGRGWHRQTMKGQAHAGTGVRGTMDGVMDYRGRGSQLLRVLYLMELRKIFVRKLLAMCTSLSDGIFCVTMSIIFTFLGSKEEEWADTPPQTLKVITLYSFPRPAGRPSGWNHSLTHLQHLLDHCIESHSHQNIMSGLIYLTSHSRHNSIVNPTKIALRPRIRANALMCIFSKTLFMSIVKQVREACSKFNTEWKMTPSTHTHADLLKKHLSFTHLVNRVCYMWVQVVISVW